MKEEIKQHLKKHWQEIATFVGAIVLLALSSIIPTSCGSTWKISGNTVNVNNKVQHDSITHYNDTINHKIREISKKRVGKNSKDTIRAIQ